MSETPSPPASYLLPSSLRCAAGLINSRPRHDAQPCYCGEDKCVGFIGGKTQTDIAGMDDLYLDGACAFFYFYVSFGLLNVPSLLTALGIADEVDRLGLKGSKKKRSKKLDEDWMVRVADRIFYSRARALRHAFCSRYLNPWPLKRCRRLFKPCGRPRAARSSSSCLRE